jgi:hypothetical protein
MALKITDLIEASKAIRMSEQDKEMQRRSFAFGNTHFENANVTRDMIAAAADSISVVSQPKAK